MKRTDMMFSFGVVLSIVVFCSCNAIGGAPSLNRTQTGFTVLAGRDNTQKVQVLLTFDQSGQIKTVERCIEDKPCEEIKLVELDRVFFYSCVPLGKDHKPEGTVTALPDPSGNSMQYDCQNITATEPGEPVIFKSGKNTSCPMIINGRACDPCKGIY